MRNTMKYFTGSYFSREINFVIQNLPVQTSDLKLPQSFSITEKNLQRGIKLKPSHYLLERLKEHYKEQVMDYTADPYLIDDHEPKWTDRTILGNPKKKSDNPAYQFYKEIDQTFGDEYNFIKKLLIPEFEIINFCQPLKDHINNKTRVDFFIPACSLVIEIDGLQHKENIDDARDEELDKFNIKTVRLKTEAIREGAHQDKVEDIKKWIDNNSEILSNYKRSLDSREYEKESYVYTSIAIHRFQILLCELIKSGKLSLDSNEWKLQVFYDFNCSFDWVGLAIDDFFEWLLPISKIFGEKIKKPENIIIDCDSSKKRDKFLNIDFFLFQRPTEDISNTITVKSWYYDFIITRPTTNYLNPKIDTNYEKVKDYCDYLEITHVDTKKNKTSIPLKYREEEGLKDFLLQAYGHNSYKDGQFRIIERVLGKENTLGLLPTGGGKSLCFQLPSSLSTGCCIVICPIIALMKDHKEELERMGFLGRVEAITKDTDPKERGFILEKIRQGRLNYIFVSPERFQNNEFRDSILELYNKKLISYVVIDEVHCISEWGHDFRTSYLVLANTLFKILKLTNVPIIGLTATASENVLNDIRSELRLQKEDVIYRMDNSREELNFHIEYTESEPDESSKPRKSDKLPILLNSIDRIRSSDIIRSERDAGIIFTMHVDYALGNNHIQQKLKQHRPNIRSAIFSGKQPDKWVNSKGARDEEDWDAYKGVVQKEFKDSDLDMMIATKSFGMGINKENIRYSIHYGMPASLEALYQEAGRCGRDGHKAENVVIFSNPMKIPNTILDGSRTVDYIKEFCEKNRSVTSDYIKQLRLMFNSKKSIKQEAKECYELLDRILKSNKEEIPADEKYLHRLYQLGIVNDWTAEQPYKKTYKPSFKKDITIDEISNNLLDEIGKYEFSDVQINHHQQEINKLKKGDPKKAKLNLIWYLIKWSNDKFLYTRRASLATLYRYCVEFHKSENGPADFKRKIDAYFRVDSVAENISKKIDINHDEAPSELKYILVDDDKLKEREQIDNIISTMARFLESYKDNPWLILLSSMCRLITDTFDDGVDGRVKLHQFIVDAKKSSNNWKRTLTDLLDFAQYLSQKEKNELAVSICGFTKDRDELLLIHKYLEDDYSGLLYLKTVNKRIENIL